MFFYQLLKKGKCFNMRLSFFLIIFLSSAITGDNLYIFKNEKDEARFNELIKDIRCPKCTSGSLASSNAPISEDLKLKIVQMINENKSNKEIKNYVASRFGEDSLYEPVLNKNTYILWYSPFIFLIMAITLFLFRQK